jgi:3-methyl-2-oxobutanoate hydroxymethyltransferase
MNITPEMLRNSKTQGRKFVGLVLYDACFAKLAQDAGIEVVHVGDSVGMTVLGNDTTVATTMDDMVYHIKAVAKGFQDGLLIGDLPFMSYATPEMAVRNATLLMQAGAHMIKLEGGGGCPSRMALPAPFAWRMALMFPPSSRRAWSVVNRWLGLASAST